MPTPKGIRLLLITSLLLFFGNFVPVASALDIDDGFGPVREAQGKHFTVYYSPNTEAFSLLHGLRIFASDQVLAGSQIGRGESAGAELANMVDILFLRVCDILDMQLYSYKGNIKICVNQAQLNEIYNRLFGKELGQKSFYVYDLNTIYISADNFTREILGHEMAHAVICHYFVVAPSVKVQEILASYVEYQLRKFSE